jgi:hypothetical protein
MSHEKVERTRTNKQNRALHKFFEESAVELNNAGISQKVLLEYLEVEHTAHSVKALFRAIGRAKFGKTSTADLTTVEVQECFEEIVRLFAQHGIVMNFPSYQETAEYLKSFDL